MSNVTVVENAQKAQRDAESKAKTAIADCKAEASRKIREAETARKEGLRKAKEMVESATRNQKIAWGSTVITLLCCFIANPALSLDIWYFISKPSVWIWDKLSIYAGWMSAPYYTKTERGIESEIAFSVGWAWALRILTLLLILGCTTVICYGIYRLLCYYKKRWCNLSLKVVLASLAVIIVFGENIKRCIHCNLCLVFLIIQTLYLGVLIYLDGYFEVRYKTKEWEQIQQA